MLAEYIHLGSILLGIYWTYVFDILIILLLQEPTWRFDVLCVQRCSSEYHCCNVWLYYCNRPVSFDQSGNSPLTSNKTFLPAELLTILKASEMCSLPFLPAFRTSELIAADDQTSQLSNVAAEKRQRYAHRIEPAGSPAVCSLEVIGCLSGITEGRKYHGLGCTSCRLQPCPSRIPQSCDSRTRKLPPAVWSKQQLPTISRRNVPKYVKIKVLH